MPTKLTQEEFISKCVAKHSTQFTYTKTNYTGYSNIITVTCTDHGDFDIKASTHTESKRGGCPDCKVRKKYTTKLFITEANKIHHNEFNYSLVGIHTSNTATEKVIVICAVHGEFETCADWHIKGKRGCQQCARDRTTAAVTDTLEAFITKATATHGAELYDYSLVELHLQDKVKIICNRCGQIFEQIPNSHINGCGCRHCNLKGGYDELYFTNNPDMKIVPAVFYKIRMYSASEEFIKVGITKRSVAERYSALTDYEYEILDETNMLLYDAFCHEQDYILTESKNRYWPGVKFDGWTECFKI